MVAIPVLLALSPAGPEAGGRPFLDPVLVPFADRFAGVDTFNCKLAGNRPFSMTYRTECDSERSPAFCSAGGGERSAAHISRVVVTRWLAVGG